MKIVLIAMLAAAPAALAEGPTEAEKCLECHSIENDVRLESGELISLALNGDAFLKSSHGKRLACTDCHTDLKGATDGHAAKRLKNKRQFAISYSESCQKCHFSNYTDTLDSVHRATLAKGNLEAAVCSDCHGAHDITSPGEPRSKISQTCSTCHKKIADQYVKSVHGQALISGNEDVPACTDCHRSHAIAGPHTASWRVKSPEMCGTCHTNEKLMAKYKLSTKVLTTYLSDFHGTTVALEQNKKGANPVVALCTDCHGVHDITKASDPNSPVLKANLLNTCKKCHPDATASFPASWLSHYEPSLSKAPLVYLVKLFYSLLIPFMIGGLALQIILHLWRIVVNR
ncbi:MAG: cytochrome c3 family protein [Myxococcales bacterium]